MKAIPRTTWEQYEREIEEENERQKAALASFHKREQKVPLRRARLWQLGLLSLVVSLLVLWYAFKPLLAWLLVTK